jgi:predicted RNase H-like HicB family nuclease
MAVAVEDRQLVDEYEFTVIIEQDEDGAFISSCPALPGCHSAGETEDEAREMIKDAIALYLDHLREKGEPIPADVTVAKVRVPA